MARKAPQLAATVRLLLLPLHERLGQDFYEVHVACGTRMSINELAAQLSHLVAPGAGIESVSGDERPGDVKHWCASIDKVARLAGCEPRISVEQGLRRTIEWYKKSA